MQITPSTNSSLFVTRAVAKQLCFQSSAWQFMAKPEPQNLLADHKPILLWLTNIYGGFNAVKLSRGQRVIVSLLSSRGLMKLT